MCTMHMGTHRASGIQLAKFAWRSRRVVLGLRPRGEVQRHGRGHMAVVSTDALSKFNS